MKYNTLRNLVARKYNQAVENGVTYFMNKAGEVVATENAKHNLLVMYVYSNRNTVWNHHDTVAVAVAKDFKLIHNYEVSVADVIVMAGLSGAYNTIERTSHMLLKVTSSVDVSFDEESFNFVEPVQIIDSGVLDSPQFAGANLNGALIDVAVRDAKGTIGKAPYIVGKGLVSKSKKIGTMGCMMSSTRISLEIGLDFDMSALASNSCRRHSHKLTFDNLVYGILSYKKLSRKAKKKNVVKYIQPKDYNVYTYLRTDNSWFWGHGYNTAGSYETRKYIMKTEHGTNYHKTALVTIIATK